MRRSGFTLIEVTVALTLGAAVVLLAHRLSSGVLDGTRRLQEARATLDREINARRWLAEAFGALDVGGEAGGFTGRPHRVQFATWQRTVDGWLAPQRMVIALAGDTLLLRGDTHVPLVRSVTAVDFDYLLEPGANAVWVREWVSPVSSPLAVRLRITRTAGVDSLLFLIGARG